MAALQASGIVKRFEETCALDGVDLVVEEGRVRGVLGPNGAGKTTLLRIIFGLVRPDAGVVELFGRSLRDYGSGALEGVAGFVEDPSFYPYLSGRVNLELLAELDGRWPGARIGETLARVGLAGRGEDRVNGYSTGMKQRLGIAASLLRSPRLLLLDEPTAGLDPGGVRDVGALVRGLAADGVSILLSSHQIDEVEEICDSFTVLRRGRVVWDGTAEEMRAQAPASAYRLQTSDDARALDVAQRHAGVRDVGALVRGLAGSLRFLTRLRWGGRAPLGVARESGRVHVLRAHQRLERRAERASRARRAGREGAREHMSTTSVLPSDALEPAGTARSAHGVWRAYRAEVRKLSSQLAVRLLALVCLIGPFVFAAILRVQSGAPTDTLYGVWVHSSGFAVSLVLLAFAGSWGLPLIAGIVAGDIFSSEDRYGTWKLVLTRSCTRGDLFGGKLLAAATFVVGLLLLTALSSLLAGVLLVGAHSLVSLNGTLFSPAHSAALVFLSWLICIPPTLAFTAIAVLLSVATRNGIVGVIGPGITALAMQLLLLVGTGIWAHLLLVGSAFSAWHGLFAAHPYYGPLLVGIAVSVIWAVVCVDVSWAMLQRRDFAGTSVSRRQGWGRPVRVVVALAAAIALIAIAGNWGPAGVTAKRLRSTLSPAFNHLTVLQQRELGRHVPAGAKLTLVLPTCNRRGSTQRGPGDWVCTIYVVTPSTGPLPSQPTPVAYDVSVQWDGCYKAQSPPAFIGQQTMPVPHGHTVVNPLYTIYGCFNPL